MMLWYSNEFRIFKCCFKKFLSLIDLHLPVTVRAGSNDDSIVKVTDSLVGCIQLLIVMPSSLSVYQLIL